MSEARSRTHEGLAAVATRLTEMGLTELTLRDAVQNGLHHAFLCTRHDPPNLPGILAWGKTIRYLRDHLVPAGWTNNNARNYATVVSPDRSFAIAVAAGDLNTGLSGEGIFPSTRSEKGPATRDAIHQNQLSFAEISDAFPPPQATPGTQTWLLLHYADEGAAEIRLELSLPANMTGEGYVTGWHERIILGPVSLAAVSEPTTEPDVTGEEFIANVKRRTTEG